MPVDSNRRRMFPYAEGQGYIRFKWAPKRKMPVKQIFCSYPIYDYLSSSNLTLFNSC